MHNIPRYFFLALSFLTRIPVPDLGKLEVVDFGRAALFYPLVGLLIGALLCLPLVLFPHAPAVLLAAIVTVLWAAITGGLHLDGLADSADAWLGGFGDVEKTHRILKDPLIGAAGAIALVGLLLLKFAALVVILENSVWWVVLLTPVLGRALVLLLFLTTPYVREGGLASAVTAHLPRTMAWWLTLATLLLVALVSLHGLGAVLLGFWLLRRMMVQRLRGCTGDTAGATLESGEMLWLLGVALGLPA
ncbi:adenosylcobinamide-GDP ribazoletransferase [Thiothrix subterranea]|uniref:Adenosylcobinamide-GDP ribazoletransferase n=1 Tax=Thiothrix subterranea TaxID=2735563 RepID=A0AA51MR51_9GAMM|nr:adenosylcobinamide-GDP ribazoletransferase [Thiothrix subterranea]MDQ5769047.1 adenosylcobinamide-GDP ribazoletransferase [Thiothrix subterranea]WML88394.1 adenosylcobinamide-GDP ribazoletransferase [Thiothrix subterranea]